MNGVGRRRRNAGPAGETAVLAPLPADVEAQMDSIAAAATAARLDEALRLNETLTRRSARFSDFLDAVLGNVPEGWMDDDLPETSALRYIRHLEAEVDRRGGSRKPPWAVRTQDGDDRGFRGLVAQWGAEELFGLPVPPRAEDTPEPAPGAPPAGDSAAAPTAAPSPVAPGAVPAEDGPVQDEPDAEADCAEGADHA